MMTKKSLASILKLQLWLHTLLTSIFFIALTFFFLFAMEDYLHGQQLTNLSKVVAENGQIKGIPEHITVYAHNEVPAAWSGALTQHKLNKSIEVRDSHGNIIHLLRASYSHNEDSFVIALDTSKTNSLWSISGTLLMLILPWTIIFLIAASFLATKFILRIQNQFESLIDTINQSESPEILEHFYQQQPIEEIAQFAQLFFHVWQQKLEILSREKQGLEYLSHELRTPIQSSLATLELMALKSEDKKSIGRLSRSLNRMTRLSNAVLFLMESDKQPATYPVDLRHICDQLIDELKPLLDMKMQTISVLTVAGMDKNSEPENAVANIISTQEVIETILSILLTNALQHSDNQPIVITIGENKVSIENQMKRPPTETATQSQGFGIGLTIAQRLASKFNLRLKITSDSNRQVIASISNN